MVALRQICAFFFFELPAELAAFLMEHHLYLSDWQMIIQTQAFTIYFL